MGKQKNFKLSKLVENLSHELRTPLSAILGYSELLEKSNNLDDAEKNHLAKITESGTQLLDVINDIIEISNIESGNIKPEESIISRDNFVSDLKHKYEALARVKEINFKVKASPNIDTQFKGDEKKIKTIIYSLINNAVKFTDKGSVFVHIYWSNVEQESNVKLFEVRIEDTGCGIPENEMRYIFTPFWQSSMNKNNGTGLGLTTCRKLVTVLDGTLEINSRPGKGTTAELRIPVKVVSKSQKGTSSKAPLVSMKNKKSLKALVVDDLPINRKLARIMLEMNNFEIIEAENGEEALDYYSGYKPDLVLMDISMPVMNGIEAMEKIRQVNKTGSKVPIIAVTAGGHTGSRSDMIERGFSEYIQKPFKEKELFEKISLFLPLSTSNMKKSSLNLTAVKL